MITVIGDIIIDKYTYGTSRRLSPEAPVPVVNFENETVQLGGAGNVYNNIKSLTENVQLVGYMSNEYLIAAPGIFMCNKMPVKQRIYSDNHYITRIDDEETIDNSNLVDYIRDNIKDQIVVLSDYNKGTLHNVQDILAVLKENNCYVIVDPKQDLSLYAGADILKPNSLEYATYDGSFEDMQVDTLVVTLGKDGFRIVNDVSDYTVGAQNQSTVFDVTGAGDTFLAAMAYYIDQGNTVEFACQMGNRAASVAVQHPGTYVIKPSDLSYPKVVFTNGCFDILHVGHIDYLTRSKQLGDYLVVGLNSDSSVKRLKGDSRPCNTQEDRKFMLESLSIVDEVIVFDEDTPLELIKKVKPDIITKGGDYTVETVVGNELAEVVIMPTVQNKSTTAIINKLKGIEYAS